jgi:hypothetical protein
LTTKVRLAGPAIAAAIAIVALSSPALADGGGGGSGGIVNCDRTPTLPVCQVTVGTGGDTTVGNPGSGSGEGSDSNASPNPCNWEFVNPQRPPPPGRGPSGGWYVQMCQLTNGVSSDVPSWFDAPPGVDVAAVARQAMAQLRLPSPEIRTSPSSAAPVLVYVPVWLWLSHDSFVSRSATASVPGLSITATATAQRVRWETGDGDVEVCTDAGTAWRTGMDPQAPSPTCGHTYLPESTNTSSGSFVARLRATVTWSVSWAGGGATGTVPDLATTSTVNLRVVLSRSVNGGGT